VNEYQGVDKLFTGAGGLGVLSVVFGRFLWTPWSGGRNWSLIMALFLVKTQSPFFVDNYELLA